MKRNEWMIILAPLFAVWFVDHITKLWGESLNAKMLLGPFIFQLYHNHGAFLGFFSDLPPLLRIVSLSTIGSFLVFSYAIAQYMLPIQSMKLRLGMSILLGGIIGNVYDRVVWGYVVDFLVLDFGLFRTHPLNLADIFQWVGYGLIAITLIKEDQILWPELNHRKRLWIYPNYQLRYILFLLIITLSLTLIGIIFSYTYLKVTIFELIGENRYIPSRFLIPYIFTYIAIALTFCGFLIIIGRRVSHRNAGPIYAFDKYVNDLLDGRNRRFKLRSGDEFKQLEKLGQRIAEYLMQNNLINEDDDVKTLTTQNASAEDFSIAAVPVDDQLPNYQTKPIDIKEVAEDSQIQHRRECPVCKTPSLMAKTSSFADYLVTCAHCAFVFDPITPKDIEKIYNDDYFIKNDGHQGFNNYESDHEVNLINFRKRLDKVLALFPNAQSYLDIGCAFGDSLEVAKEKGFSEIIGIELSRFASEKASQKGFTVLQGTLDQVKSKLQFYDLIMLSDVIEHVADPKSLLTQCREHLTDDGLICLHTPNLDSWSARILKRRWYHLKKNEHIGFFTPVTLQGLAEECGLTVVSCEKSMSYLSISAIARRLKTYGMGWIEKLVKILPSPLREKLILPLRTGNMIVVLKIQK